MTVSLPSAAGRAADVTDVLFALPDGYLLADLDGRLVAANPAALRLARWSDPAPGHLAELTSDPARLGEVLERWRTSADPRPARLELTTGVAMRCDGARVPRTAAILIRVRHPATATRSFRDVTADVRSDNLRRRQQQLDRTVRQLHDAKRRLEEANAELRQHAHAIAHDIRTPLFTLQGAARHLDVGGHVDPEGDPYLDLVLASATRLQAVTDSLLAVARIGRRPWSPEALDTELVVEGVLAELTCDLAAAGAEVTVGSIPPVVADRLAVHQVLYELVTNALHCRSEERPLRIDITGRRQAELVEVAVTDNGVGVADEARERLFELFQRGLSRPAAPGRGVGLTTCRKLVTRWGGSIRCEPANGPGARFVFTAPSSRGHGSVAPPSRQASTSPSARPGTVPPER